MSNKKQSSVEWLMQQLIGPCRGIPSHIIEQAKAMHKAEIMQTYSDGLGNGMHFERGDGSAKDLDEEQ